MNKRKEQKRKEAEARQAKYDALTLRQRIDLARSRRGNSLREVSRLLKHIEILTA